VDYQRDLGWVCNSLGELYLAAGQPARALECLQEALLIFDRLGRRDGSNLSYRSGRAWARTYLGKWYRWYCKEDPPEATEYLNQARKELEDLTRQREDSDDRYNLAQVYALQGESDLAVKALQRARARGFGNVGRLEAEKAFLPLRGDQNYKQLLAEMKGP
jgi:tetratricopeptide (TPR) repeat protein